MGRKIFRPFVSHGLLSSFNAQQSVVRIRIAEEVFIY